MEEFHFQDCGAILIGFIVSIVVIRLAYVLYWSGRPLRTSSQRVSTLIVLGSGGHTAEMLSIVNVLEKERFVPRIYMAAGTDNMSLHKARVLEESLIQKGEIGSNKGMKEVAYFKQIYRSREVGQSYLTSIYTTLVAILHALWLMLHFRPEVVWHPTVVVELPNKSWVIYTYHPIPILSAMGLGPAFLSVLLHLSSR